MTETTEYITLQEALRITGLSEKTLRAKLRGHATIFGHGSWDRKEFFAFWKEANHRKTQRREEDIRIHAQLLGKSIARKTRKGRIKNGKGIES